MKIKILFIAIFIPNLSFAQFSNPGKECLDSFKKELFDPESSYAVAMDKDNLLRYRTKNRDGIEVMRYAYCWNVTEGKWTRNRSKEIINSMNYAAEQLNGSAACIKSGNSTSYCRNKYPGRDPDDAAFILGFK